MEEKDYMEEWKASDKELGEIKFCIETETRHSVCFGELSNIFYDYELAMEILDINDNYFCENMYGESSGAHEFDCDDIEKNIRKDGVNIAYKIFGKDNNFTVDNIVDWKLWESFKKQVNDRCFYLKY